MNSPTEILSAHRLSGPRSLFGQNWPFMTISQRHQIKPKHALVENLEIREVQK